MYDQFYGFSGRPFQLTPDPNFYFESGTHRKAMSYLGYGLAQGEGFIVITGDIGAGKTTLVGHLMNGIDPNRLTAVKLVSTAVSGDALLQLVAEQFGLDWEGLGKAELLRNIESFLREQARAGRRTLLIVDEGQNLPVDALEELRMLSNFQLGGHSLLQIFLLGQPEFRQTLFQSPSLEQLRQRVIATHHLDPMEPEEVEPYILHRLGKVGWQGNPSFTPDAFALLFDHSDGVPRRLNVLVSRVLLYGAVEQVSRITGAHVGAVVAEMSADGGFVQAAEAPPPPPAMPVAAEAAPLSLAPQPLPVPATEPAPDSITPDASEPLADAAVPLEWPVRSAPSSPEPVSPSHVSEPADIAPPPAPFAAPAAPLAGNDQAWQSEPVIEATAAPSAAPSAPSFMEARSLVADRLAVAAPVADPLDIAPASFDAAAPYMAQEPDAAAEPEASAEASAIVDPEAVVALQRQIAGLEARMADQDAALRRVLDLLIDWVERDPAGAPKAQDWAA